MCLPVLWCFSTCSSRLWPTQTWCYISAFTPSMFLHQLILYRPRFQQTKFCAEDCLHTTALTRNSFRTTLAFASSLYTPPAFTPTSSHTIKFLYTNHHQPAFTPSSSHSNKLWTNQMLHPNWNLFRPYLDDPTEDAETSWDYYPCTDPWNLPEKPPSHCPEELLGVEITRGSWKLAYSYSISWGSVTKTGKLRRKW